MCGAMLHSPPSTAHLDVYSDWWGICRGHVSAPTGGPLPSRGMHVVEGVLRIREALLAWQTSLCLLSRG